MNKFEEHARLVDNVHSLYIELVTDGFENENDEPLHSDKIAYLLEEGYNSRALRMLLNNLWGMYDTPIRGTVYTDMGSIHYDGGYIRFNHDGIIIGSGDTIVDHIGLVNINRIYFSVSSNDWVDIHLATKTAKVSFCFPAPVQQQL